MKEEIEKITEGDPDRQLKAARAVYGNIILPRRNRDIDEGQSEREANRHHRPKSSPSIRRVSRAYLHSRRSEDQGREGSCQEQEDVHRHAPATGGADPCSSAPGAVEASTGPCERPPEEVGLSESEFIPQARPC